LLTEAPVFDNSYRQHRLHGGETLLCQDVGSLITAQIAMRSSLATRSSSLPLNSISYILASMFCFAVVDALGKSVSLDYPANEVTFFRMLFGLVPAIAVFQHGNLSIRAQLKSLDLKGQSVRAVTLLAASCLFFAGLPYMPLGEAVSIAYSETLLVVVLAPLLLREPMTRRAAFSAMIGFLGVLLVVRPGGEHSSWLGPVCLMLSALFGALSILQIKRIHSSDDSRTTVLFFTVIGTLVTACSLPFQWQTPSWHALAIFALLGTFATIGQLLLTIAYRRADAGPLAPFNYTSIVWAALFGYVLWGETIAPLSLGGIVLIVGSAIAVAIKRKDPDGPNA
jgi:drug/metabolite transporter (DMT)-like permease